MSVFVFYPLQCRSTFPLSHHHPPPVLTLACLSGLLPCIPPFPVWPLSQEVAQLVDKHHGGDGEEGVREVYPPPPLRINGGSLMEMESSLGCVTVDTLRPTNERIASFAAELHPKKEPRLD